MTIEDIKRVCQIYDNLKRERDAATIAYNSDDAFWEHVLTTCNFTVPSLPSNLDEAAEEAAKTWRKNPDGSESREIFFLPFIRGFKAGVEWMAGQGWKEVDNKNYPVPDKKKIYIVYTKEHYHLARVINHPKDDNLYQWKCTEFPNHRYDMCEGDKYFEIRKK